MKSLIRFLIIFMFSMCLLHKVNAQVKTKTFYKGIPAEMITNRDSIIKEKSITAPENFSD
jgi:hypothetical protein